MVSWATASVPNRQFPPSQSPGLPVTPISAGNNHYAGADHRRSDAVYAWANDDGQLAKSHRALRKVRLLLKVSALTQVVADLPTAPAAVAGGNVWLWAR